MQKEIEELREENNRLKQLLKIAKENLEKEFNPNPDTVQLI